jgi:hypothetical protein
VDDPRDAQCVWLWTVRALGVACTDHISLSGSKGKIMLSDRFPFIDDKSAGAHCA